MMPPRQIVEALQRGFHAFQAGDLGKAEAAFRKVLSKDERQFDALHLLAVIQAQRGNHAEGIRLISKALAINPAFADAYVNLGRMQAESGDLQAAAESYRRAISLNPRLPVAHSNFSAVLRRLGNREEALSHTHAALKMAPDYGDAWCNRGLILLEMERFGEACASYERVLALDPANVEAAMGRALAFQSAGRHVDAISGFDRVLQLRPDQPYASHYRLYSKMLICDWSGHEDDRDRLIARVREAPSIARPFVFVAISASAADHRKCAEDHMKDVVPAVTPLPARTLAHRIGAHDKIRLAYLSGDFREHPVARQMAGVFERHDRSRFEVTALSFDPNIDDVSRRLAGAFDRFIDVASRSDQAVAEAIRDLEIDIAVDLNIFTNNGRPGILARRPAPVQVNYLGYPGTSGAPFIDYLIADPVIIPAADQQFYSEKIVYLPDTYMPNDDRRSCPVSAPTRQAEGLPDGGFVFCGFNGSYKLTPAVFDIWVRLLRQIDGSVLWLRNSYPESSENLRREAEKRGVAAGRLVFARPATMETHLARHRLADLFLDTLPFNAHSTASDALWMGLPVVTCLGATCAGRAAASMVQAAGVPELIAPSLDDYEKLALKLAQEPALLASFRERLEAGRRCSPLFDTARFTRHIEAAYVGMWERQQRGEPPASFAVEALERPALQVGQRRSPDASI
jgi:predicted O-linked N-acetylglucosamine transferase (SPINDLY family)